MTDINTLLNKKYKTFASFISEYQKSEQAIASLEANLKTSKENKNGLTLENQITLYKWTLEHVKWNSETESYDYAELRDKLPTIYPELGEYLRAQARISSYKNSLNNMLVYGIDLKRDLQPHIYIPTESGIRCLLTGEEIGGCKSPEEVTFLQKAAKEQHVLVGEYKEEDAEYVREYLTHYNINASSKIDDGTIYSIVDDLNRSLKSKHEAEIFINASQSPVPKKTL